MRIALRSLLLTCFVGGLLLGCGDREVLNVSAPPVPGPPEFIASPQFGTPLQSGVKTVSKAMTRSGGDISIDKYKVSIPRQALSQNATVTVTVVDGEFAWIRVTAQTATLTKPMTLKLTSLNETDGARLNNLSWYRASHTGWPMLASVRSASELSAQSASFGDFKIGVVQVGGNIQWIRWLDGPGYQTAWIDANKGGNVAYGRYKLDIPARALAQSTYITVRDPGSGYLECQLLPHGLHFLSPVTLRIDLEHSNYDDQHTDWTTWWLNENTGAWEDQGGVFSLKKIYTQLWHFSCYRPGRAGW